MYSVEKVCSDGENGETFLDVCAPMCRSDVLHSCDIMEDIAIGYGFQNLPKTIPTSSTIAAPFPLNKLSDAIRLEMALSGFTEALTLTLVNMDRLLFLPIQMSHIYPYVSMCIETICPSHNIKRTFSMLRLCLFSVLPKSWVLF